MQTKIYQKLAEHLDRLPDGFAPSETGADIELLKRLFTPEQAELATYLTLIQEDADTIASRAGLPLDITQRLLDEMVQKGLIFGVYPKDGLPVYQAAPFVVGIYEFQVNRLPELHQDLTAYWTTRQPRTRQKTIPQMRTIPIEESLDPRLEVLPYEQVSELVNAQERFAVASCICRRHAKLEGGGCDAPEESCLMFGEFADYYVRGGMGRYIEKSEVKDILTRADAANLVLSPTNSREIGAICCCCGCCCGILNGLKSQPKPAEAVSSAFISEYDAGLCTGCWTCLERCQMDAITEDGDRVKHNADRCIGCGLCVTTCPSDALKLVRKPESELARVPETMFDTWQIIADTQS